MGNEEGNPPDGESPPQTDKSEDQPPSRSGRKWLWVGAFVLAILALFLTFHLRSQAKSGKAPAKPEGASINIGQSRTGDINIYVEALGTVTPTYTVTVYSQITGKILAVHYTEANSSKPAIRSSISIRSLTRRC
jgi:multidrug efflux pump subunit AcrA (membrane-fusion protein)